MKQIFTLCLLAACSTASFAQSQNFNTAGTITNLQNNCWLFYGLSESTVSPIEGARQLRVVPAISTNNNPQSNSNVGQIATPYLNFNYGAQVSFSYRLESKLNNNAQRYLTVRLYDDVNSQVLWTATLDKNTPLTNQATPTILVPANSGVKRLVLDFTGDGDGNTGMYFDVLNIANAPYSYNSSTCAPLITAGATLPLRLMHFSGNATQDKPSLLWTVADNEQGNYFEVEQSTDGTRFQSVGLLFGTGKAGTESYQFAPPATKAAATYYRLRAVSLDGSVAYSKVVRLGATNATPAGNLRLLQNPVRSTLALQYSASANGQATLVVYRADGRQVHTTNVQCTKGENQVHLALPAGINAGLYFVSVRMGSESATERMIKE